MKQLFTLLLAACCTYANGQLLINEIAPNNSGYYDDEDNTFPDWIELVNTGATTLNVGGYAITDDMDTWNQWLLGNYNIPAGGRLRIFASAKNRDCFTCGGVVSEMHTNFKLSYGETLALYDDAGNLLDSLTIPTLQAGHTMARIPDGGTWCYSGTPTPNATNTGTCYSGYAAAPTFNTQPGFYTGSVDVTASGAEVRYTTDGDWPGFASTLYTTPIHVTANTVVKLTGIEAGKLPSRVVTGSFFIDEPTLLPVVSISSNSCDMFDEGASCIAAYDGADGWEPDNPQISAAVEYFTADKVQQFEKRIKFETAGNSSIFVYPQRGMQFTCDEDFGETSEFQFNLFAASKPDLDSLNGFRVRANNDWGNSAARMKDVINNRIALPTNIVVPAYQNVATFINGEYWGHYSAREELDAYFLRNNLGVNPDKVDLIRSGAGEDVWDIAEFGTMTAYNELSTFFNTHNMADPDDYALALGLIDKENWIDHFALQFFVNNDEMAYNLRCFRSYDPDMKWKFILWDTGAGSECETCNSIQSLINFPYLSDEINMMNDLMDNEDFKIDFINRYADLMNYYFTWDRIESLIDVNADEIEAEIPAQNARWGTGTLATWNNGVSELKAFFDNRVYYQRNEIENYLDMNDQVNVTLEVSPAGAGYIKISTIIPQELPWTGVYFDGAPVTVTVMANPGYTFSNWTDNPFIASETDPSFTVNITENTTFTANFTGAAIANPIYISEINYNSDSSLQSGDWIEIHNTAGVAVDVSNYTFSNNYFYNKFLIPSGTIIPANGFLVLVEDTALFTSMHPDVSSFVGPLHFPIRNEGDSVTLRNAVGEVLMSFAFNDKRPWPITADGYGRTLEFPYYFTDPSLPENWLAGCIGGSPGLPYTPCIENPVIEEINYKSAITEDAGDWFEFYNWAAAPFDLSGWKVMDKNKNVFTIPNGTQIPGGGGYYVVYQDETKFFAQFPTVTNATGPTIFGFDGEGDVISIFDQDGQLRYSIGYDDEAPYPLSPDGGGTALQMINTALNGNDPANWTESCPEGSPGTEFVMPCANSIEQQEPELSLQVSPNPGSTLFNISIPGMTGEASILIADVTGNIIYNVELIHTNEFIIDLTKYPAGIYHVRAVNGDYTYTAQIVKL
ncbi:MAG TPA: lamin tail domain-containing protein [Chitinophagales bacterium]|nr:lamin tail domain-containing protein [Chitinophagales bacterium]